ncbi:MAG: general secretion pathway protein GspK [Candidatus Omnitrophota bacterium]
MKRGSILIITLWSLGMLTVFSVYLGFAVRQKMVMMDRLDTEQQLRNIAESGARKAITQLRREDTTPDFDALNEAWSENDSEFKEIPVGDGAFSVSYEYQQNGERAVRYGLADEERKINLNTAETDVIARILEIAAGLPLESAKSLAFCIIDWKDEDTAFQHPNYGAEDSDYRFMNPPYESKDSRFEMVEELLLVKGMTTEIYERVRPYVTVYTEGPVNINTAPQAVLAALGMSEPLTKMIIAYRNGENETIGTADDNVFEGPERIVSQLSQVSKMSPSETAELSNLVSEGIFVTRSENFMVQSAAELGTGKPVSVRVEAVVTRNGQVLHWKETEQVGRI